ncbi:MULTISPECIES: hypothetical protein [Pseudoalteromonas]|uniref:Uncharacterized protein n=1 Tax=Pseudoalteromonas luteoviolacea (strain 2ta16) TaxID=1353533 RepID=V4HNH1_PSEL2|nr:MULTISPECIES: hypothetical protein [Pseudoalteromonas]ESP91298.1 hypothetical protein PL2TA16_00846 [Pseudoalteromonas luteoviolacea 2ta16]KZN39619.1 hypothetical protein N483_19055 [Pseudoalteromonas luteoviolacea NCIMB 1944]MCG7550985.1 hypothetical protein [Pseudoalteromonas sp. Of7M-16]
MESEFQEHPQVQVSKHGFSTVLSQCQAMAEFSFHKGIKVPESIMVKLEQMHAQDESKIEAKVLTQVHNRLTDLVAPAKPETIWLMSEETKKGSWLLFLGRVPLIRKMMLVAIISLVALIALSLSSYINNENMVASMFDMEGTRLLYVQAILLASAAIGASFAALFKANSYVTAGVYDPKFESSYWVRFVVGLIAGIILTQLIPVNLDAVANAASSETGGAPVSHAALRITMALVGGFSANLVYKILDRIVETVQSFISPTVPDDPQVLKQNLENQFRKQELEQLTLWSQGIVAIQSRLALEPNMPNSKVQQLLADYLNEIMNAHEER